MEISTFAWEKEAGYLMWESKGKGTAVGIIQCEGSDDLLMDSEDEVIRDGCIFKLDGL
jgi:hypothetical protein